MAIIHQSHAIDDHIEVSHQSSSFFVSRFNLWFLGDVQFSVDDFSARILGLPIPQELLVQRQIKDHQRLGGATTGLVEPPNIASIAQNSPATDAGAAQRMPSGLCRQSHRGKPHFYQSNPFQIICICFSLPPSFSLFALLWACSAFEVCFSTDRRVWPPTATLDRWHDLSGCSTRNYQLGERIFALSHSLSGSMLYNLYCT